MARGEGVYIRVRGPRHRRWRGGMPLFCFLHAAFVLWTGSRGCLRTVDSAPSRALGGRATGRVTLGTPRLGLGHRCVCGSTRSAGARRGGRRQRPPRPCRRGRAEGPKRAPSAEAAGGRPRHDWTGAPRQQVVPQGHLAVHSAGASRAGRGAGARRARRGGAGEARARRARARAHAHAHTRNRRAS